MVILICGKICSGKSFFGRELSSERNGVILSCDEVSADIFHHSEGERFDEIAADIKKYLHKIAARVASAGVDVILDWGFWTKAERQAVSEYYTSLGLSFEWHYLNISDDEWKENIRLRNEAVLSGQTTDFYVDDGLLKKLEERFEVPDASEPMLSHNFTRKRF